jgi:hypothetical protein
MPEVYRRTIEPDYERLIFAVYSETPDNSQKQNALNEVSVLVNSGAMVYKCEDLNGTFSGVQVIDGEEVLFSKFRK